MSKKKHRNGVVYKFIELDPNITFVEASDMLWETIGYWDVLVKRFSLKGEDDNRAIQKCQFYAKNLIKKHPKLEHTHLKNYYDEAVCEFAGLKYVVRRDGLAQEKAGFSPVIFEGKRLYLFPTNNEEDTP